MLEWAGTYRWSVVWMTVFLMLASIDVTIITPSVSQYIEWLQNEGDGNKDNSSIPLTQEGGVHSPRTLTGLAIGGFSVAQMFSMPLMSRCADVNLGWTLRIGLVLLAVGNILYALAWHPYVVIGSRVVAGAAAGVHGIPFSYVPQVAASMKHDGVDNLPKAMSLLRGAGAVAVVCAPALASVFTWIEMDVYIGEYTMTVNAFRSPGYFMGMCFIVATILSVRLRPLAKNESTQSLLLSSNHHEDAEQPRPDPTPTSTLQVSRGRRFVFINLACQYSIMALLTFNAPVMDGRYGWSITQITFVFIGMGVGELITGLLLYNMSHYYKHRQLQLLVCGVTIQLLSLGLLAQYGSVWTMTSIMYVIGCVLHAICAITVSTLTGSLFSVLFANGPSATEATALVYSYIVPGAVAPIVTGYLLDQVGLDAALVCSSLVIVMAFVMLVIELRIDKSTKDKLPLPQEHTV